MATSEGMQQLSCKGGVTVVMCGSDTDSDGWSDVEETAEQPVDCLFCTCSFKTANAAISHCRAVHYLAAIRSRYNLDCYGFIKLVNYVRTHHVDSHFLLNNTSVPPPWESKKYLQPVQIDDPWLMIDVDEFDSDPDEAKQPWKGEEKFHIVNAEGGLITLSEEHFTDLQQKIRTLTAQTLNQDAAIKELVADMEQMRKTTQNLICGPDESLEKQKEKEKCVKSVSLQDDEWYFNTYAHVGIHQQMLTDRVRTMSYRDAILNNVESVKGRTVLDLGCGTGILSMFAASAGAAHVIGVDQSDIIYRAIDIVRDNGFSDRINLIKGRLEDTELPVKEVDIIVSEWMGYFLLYEGMLDSVIYARDNHLAKDGLLMPNRCSLSVVGLGDLEQHKEVVGFWSDVYGFRMNCLRQEVLEEPLDIIVDNTKIITTPSELMSLDLHTCTTKDLDFSADFTLEATSDDVLTAIVGYFDTFFDLPTPVSFSTGPHATPTHWKQTQFFLEDPIPVQKGDIVSGKLICQRTMSAVRSLNIQLVIMGKSYKYYFN